MEMDVDFCETSGTIQVPYIQGYQVTNSGLIVLSNPS